MKPGDTMKQKGPQSKFRPKAHPPASILLTEEGKGILRDTAERTGSSQSDVVEALLRKYAGRLK